MDEQAYDHCVSAVGLMHILIAFMGGLNALLTTWLTLRARRRDKREANGN